MKDLLVLVADKSIGAAVDGVLSRPQSLGIREVSHDTMVHPRRDSGCFFRAEELLDSEQDAYAHALVILDARWGGAPAPDGPTLERMLESRLDRYAGWLRAVVIDPELEAWVFARSPHVARVLGWSGGTDDMRATLQREGLWPDGELKPPDPKAAMDWLLRRARIPRSSSLFRDLAGAVTLRNCSDRAFTRLRTTLREWFPPRG